MIASGPLTGSEMAAQLSQQYVDFSQQREWEMMQGVRQFNNQWTPENANVHSTDYSNQGQGYYNWINAAAPPMEMLSPACPSTLSFLPPTYNPSYGPALFPSIPPTYPVMDMNSLARLASRIQWEQQVLYQQLAFLQAQTYYTGLPHDLHTSMYMGNQGLRPPLQSAIIRDDKSVSSKVTETTESGGFLAASLSQNGQGRQYGKRREKTNAMKMLNDIERLTRMSSSNLCQSSTLKENGSYSHQCAAVMGLGFEPRHLMPPLNPLDCPPAPTDSSSHTLDMPKQLGPQNNFIGNDCETSVSHKVSLWPGNSAGHLSVQGTVGSSQDCGIITDRDGGLTDTRDMSSDCGGVPSEDGRESWGINSAPPTPSGRSRGGSGGREERITNDRRKGRSQIRRRGRRPIKVGSSTATSTKSSDGSTDGSSVPALRKPKLMPVNKENIQSNSVKCSTEYKSPCAVPITGESNSSSPDVIDNKHITNVEDNHHKNTALVSDPAVENLNKNEMLDVSSKETQETVTNGGNKQKSSNLQNKLKNRSLVSSTDKKKPTKSKRSRHGHFLLCGISRNSSGSCPHLAENSDALEDGATFQSDDKEVLKLSAQEDSELEREMVVEDITRKLLHGCKIGDAKHGDSGTCDSEAFDTNLDSEVYDSECSIDSEERVQIERMLEGVRQKGIRESSISLNTQDFALYEQEFEATGNATRSTRLPPLTLTKNSQPISSYGCNMQEKVNSAAEHVDKVKKKEEKHAEKLKTVPNTDRRRSKSQGRSHFQNCKLQ